MTTSGTYYYPPCAGTGGFLFSNPPFKMTNQPITPGLPGLSEAAYQRGADDQLEACEQWLRTHGWNKLATRLRAAMRSKPLSLKEQALAVLDDCNLDAAHENTLRRALEALPE